MQERTRIARERLILSGMELYARFGVEGVSLRAVNEHAGSQNHSAAHYHFKTKENFIEHIIAYMFDIDDAEIDGYIEAHGRHFTGVERVIFGMMAPVLVIYDNRKWGRNALKFLAILLISKEANELTLWSNDMVSSNNEFIDDLSKHLPLLKPSDLRLRASFMYINLIVGLASDEATENTVFGDLSEVSEDEQFAYLFAYCVGGMTRGASEGDGPPISRAACMSLDTWVFGRLALRFQPPLRRICSASRCLRNAWPFPPAFLSGFKSYWRLILIFSLLSRAVFTGGEVRNRCPCHAFTKC